MSTDAADDDEPAGEPEPDVPDRSDPSAELARQTMELGRQAAEAVRTVQDMAQAHARTYRFALEAVNSASMRAAVDAAARQQKLVRDVHDVTNGPAFRLAAELADSPGIRAAAQAAESAKAIQQWASSPAANLAAEIAAAWQRFQNNATDRMIETIQAIQATSKQVRPWIKKVAATAGKTIDTIYRQAAPPNWTNDEAAPLSYTSAVALALEEGIPLAWAPDHDTVRMLLAVPSGPDRRTALHAILADRATQILDHCHAQLNELAAAPNAASDCHRMIEVARQSIQALRADLPAPAQSAAANLADHLLRRLFVPLDGKYAYRATSKRVTSLSEQINEMSLRYLVILRELATLVPVPKSLTEWWPDKDMPLPDTFSRHATAHAIAEPGQVNPTNALIAIMLAVSLLCQETASRWTALGNFLWTPEDND